MKTWLNILFTCTLIYTPVQKYRSSVKALIHNSPPSVHGTCCVIKAVLYPLLQLVNLSHLMPCTLVSPNCFFRAVSHCLVQLFSCSLWCQTPHTHTHTHTVIFSPSCFAFISVRALCVSLCLALSLSHAQNIFFSWSSAPLFITSSHCFQLLYSSLSTIQCCQWLHSQHMPAAAPYYQGQVAFFTTHLGH